MGLYGGMPPVKILKSGPFRVHFQHPGAEIRVFERKIDIISSGREGGGEGSNFQRKLGGKFM